MPPTEFKLILLNVSEADVPHVHRAVANFNRCQDEYTIASPIEVVRLQVPGNLLDWDALFPELKRLARESRHCIFVTSQRLRDNYFTHTRDGVTLITTADWLTFFAPPNTDCHLLRAFTRATLIQSCQVSEDGIKPHESRTGCFLDWCPDKSDILLVMRSGFICEEHRSLFRQWGGTEGQLLALESLLDVVRSTTLGRPPGTQAQRSTPERSRAGGAEVAIFCALKRPELEKVLQSIKPQSTLDDWTPEFGPQGSPYSYYLTEFEVDSRNRQGTERIKVAAVAAQHMGLTASAVLATQTLMHFRPRLAMMVGIAAGVDSTRQGYGDILVADHAFNYTFGKLTPEKQGGFKPDFRQVEINRRLAELVDQFASASTLNDIRTRWPGDSPPMLRMHLGPLGSADQVVDDADRVREVQTHSRKLIGIEMETYSIYRACVETNTPLFLSFKSICDFAALKDDTWQKYAAYTSAEFAIRFLRANWKWLAA